MHFKRLLLFFSIISVCVCARRYSPPQQHRSSSRSPKIEDALSQPPDDPNLPHKRVSSSINKFSNRMWKVMNEYSVEEEHQPSFTDLVYSPVSVFVSLATLLSGASSESRSEIATILSLSKINESVIQEGVSSILQTYNPDSGSSVRILNRVFLDHSYHPTNRYVNSVRDKFNGELVQTHFSNATAASIFVNNHVSQASNGVLQDIISVEPPESSSTESSVNETAHSPAPAQVIDGGLMLISGFTFEGDFSRPFTPLLTRKETFTREDGSHTQVDMMHRDGVYLYAEIPELNATALTIMYRDYRYSFTVLLPEENVRLAELEENLESFPCIAVMSRLKKQYVQVSIPRFGVENTVDLIDPLQGIGIRRVFSEEHAQLARIVENVDVGELYLTNAVHKVSFDVSEGGTRAPSQNFIEAIPVQARVLTPFTANRPFVFFVADQLLNSVLVVGRKAV